MESVHELRYFGLPTCGGQAGLEEPAPYCDTGASRDLQKHWIPIFTGMTEKKPKAI